MDLAHDVWPRDQKHLGAVLLAEEVALDVERHRLDPRAEAAVAEQNLVLERIEQMRA